MMLKSVNRPLRKLDHDTVFDTLYQKSNPIFFTPAGCGAYCDNTIGAVSTTGHGESIMKVTLARDILYNIQQGKMKRTSLRHGFWKCVYIMWLCKSFPLLTRMIVERQDIISQKVV